MPCESSERDLRASGERMIVRHCGREFFIDDDVPPEIGHRGTRAADEHEVEVAVAYAVEQPGGLGLVQRYLHVGVARMESGEQSRHGRAARPDHRADDYA